MVFHWRLSDNKFTQISRTLLGILVDAVVWMVSCRRISERISYNWYHHIIIIIIIISSSSSSSSSSS